MKATESKATMIILNLSELLKVAKLVVPSEESAAKKQKYEDHFGILKKIEKALKLSDLVIQYKVTRNQRGL